MSFQDKRHVAFSSDTSEYPASPTEDEGDVLSAMSADDEDSALPISNRQRHRRKDGAILDMEFTRWREVRCFAGLRNAKVDAVQFAK